MASKTTDPDEKAAQKKLDALKPLIEKFRQQQAASYETLEEMMALLGGVPIGDLLKRLETAFADAWAARYRDTYVWTYVQDRPQMKRLLRHLAPEEIEARMVRYVRSADPFYQKARHPFRLFASNPNQWASERPSETFDLNADESPAIGCQHTPRCPSDSAHTTLMNRDRRSAF